MRFRWFLFYNNCLSGVQFSLEKSFQYLFLIIQIHASPQVSAKLCTRLKNSAANEAGETGQTSEENNVARNAYRMIKRFGISWKIEPDVYQFKGDDGSEIPIHYFDPGKLLQYLIDQHPVVVFGTGNHNKIQKSLAAFWQGYSKYHPTHEAFTLNEPYHLLIPIALHGDEGRGKRRSNTTVFSMEAVLGIKGHSSQCCKCVPVGSWDAPYGTESEPQHPFLHLLRHNMKSHSYLQHWPLFVLPGTLWKNYKELTNELIEFLGRQFKKLFEEGLEAGGLRYRVVVIGSKGDLKWVSKIAALTRGYERKGRVTDVPCCHQCMAGTSDCPAEDFSIMPVWAGTQHQERPWSNNNLPALHCVPFDRHKPEWLYRHDPFHTLRIGVYRDFVGSTLFLWIRWKYFGNAIPQQLEAAHGHFTLWLRATKNTAALRSFSTALFNYKNSGSYVWANVKGSDVTLLCKWIATASAGFLLEEQDVTRRDVLKVIQSAARLATEFFDVIYKHGVFLTRPCAGHLYEKGQAFLQGFSFLAQHSMNAGLCLYSLKPKMHFQKHILLEVYEQLQQGCASVVNPVIWDCSQNEDVIGRICKLGRLCDTRVLTQRVLEFYAIKAAILLRRHRRVHRDLDC